jgi:hypothetical protein
MACTAAHALFTNPQLQALPQARAPTASLLLLLTMLVRDSANFKVCLLSRWMQSSRCSGSRVGCVLSDVLALALCVFVKVCSPSRFTFRERSVGACEECVAGMSKGCVAGMSEGPSLREVLQ